MSKSVLAAIAVASLAVAAGTVAGSFHIELQNSGGTMVASQDVADVTAPVTFASVGPGDYQVSAVRLDASGAPIGTPVVSAVFTVAADPTTINVDVPASVTVTLA